MGYGLLPYHLGESLAAGVMQLGGSGCPRVLDGQSQPLESREKAVVVDTQFAGKAPARRMDGQYLGNDQTHSGTSSPRQVAQQPVGDLALRRTVTGTHGRHHRAVLKREPAQPGGLLQESQQLTLSSGTLARVYRVTPHTDYN